MSLTTVCDRCKRGLLKGDGERSEPWLKKYGDMQDAVGMATDSCGGVLFGPGRHKTDEEERTMRPDGQPGYGIGRGEDGLVSMWVTWRSQSDFCRSCVEITILQAAELVKASTVHAGEASNG